MCLESSDLGSREVEESHRGAGGTHGIMRGTKLACVSSPHLDLTSEIANVSSPHMGLTTEFDSCIFSAFGLHIKSKYVHVLPSRTFNLVNTLCDLSVWSFWPWGKAWSEGSLSEKKSWEICSKEKIKTSLQGDCIMKSLRFGLVIFGASFRPEGFHRNEAKG